MQQTKLESLVEVCLNVAIGFFVSFSLWPVVAWLHDLPFSVGQSFTITAIFTITSVARSYIVRRWFNAGLHNTARHITRQLISRRFPDA